MWLRHEEALESLHLGEGSTLFVLHEFFKNL
jgi:hypothetical protein